MLIVLFTVLILALLPGIVVEILCLRYMVKNGKTQAVWDFLHPVAFVLFCVVGFPVLSFGYYSVLFTPASQRLEVLETTLAGIASDDLSKKAIIFGLASMFGIKIENL